MKTKKILTKFFLLFVGFPIFLSHFFKNKIFKKKIECPQNIKKILVVNLDKIGDSLFATPAIRVLKERFIDSEIVALARYPEIFEGNQNISRIYHWKGNGFFSWIANYRKHFKVLREEKFNLGVVLEGSPHMSTLLVLFLWIAKIEYLIGSNLGLYSSLFTKRYFIKEDTPFSKLYLNIVGLVGATAELNKLDFFVPEIARDNIGNFLTSKGINKNVILIGIHPGSGKYIPSTQWPVERFAQLADRIMNTFKANVVITGTEKEKDLANKMISIMDKKPVVLAGKTKLKELGALIERCHIFITNDTGPLHVAGALNVQTIGIFGPDSPKRVGLLGDYHHPIWKGLKCSPCAQHKKRGRCVSKQKEECLTLITVDEVFEVVKKLIKRSI